MNIAVPGKLIGFNAENTTYARLRKNWLDEVTGTVIDSASLRYMRSVLIPG